MIKRDLQLPNASFFLFGPRSTGKTTWLTQTLGKASWFNLLLDDEYYSLLADPKLLIQKTELLEAGSWIVIDEIQRIPKLLDSVHYLMTKYPDKYLFAISGSSARKLKRLDVNLLAGRVIERNFFPLTAHELSDKFNPDQALDTGLLPLVYLNPDLARDRLLAYVNMYLKQEIQQEALTDDIPGFSRFLRASSLLNGSIINYSNVSRDANLKRRTTEKFFSILTDTLISFWLPAWQPKATVKEVAKPKFYFFDPGVVRACANRTGIPPAPEEKGTLFETYIIHEIRSYMNVSNTGGELSYWNSGSGTEVDLIWSHGDTHIGLEIKSSQSWRSSYNKGLNTLLERKKIVKAYGVYTGKHSLKSGNVNVLTVKDFISLMYQGSLFV